MEASVAARRGGNVRFAAHDLQRARVERGLKDSPAVHAHPARRQDIERVAEAAYAAVETPRARSGEARC